MALEKTLVCKKCGAEIRINPDGSTICDTCGLTRTEPFALCPRCLQFSPQGADTCPDCGSDLKAVCAVCGCVNWAGAEQCTRCGREINAMNHFFRSFRRSYDERVEKTRANLPNLRQQEEEGSERRMRELAAIDRYRLEVEAGRAEKRKVREQTLIRVMGGVVIAFIILSVLVVVLLQ